LKWQPTEVNAEPPPESPAPTIQKIGKPNTKVNKTLPVSVASSEKHDVFKRENRWHCKKCPCSATYSNSARFENVTCLGDKCHMFEAKKMVFYLSQMRGNCCE